MPTLVVGRFFYLYLFLDIFSRKIVGWQVYDCESCELAGEVMRNICMRENIAPNQVVLHFDTRTRMIFDILAPVLNIRVSKSRSR